MIIIELCGPPCSGKTYILNFLEKRFKGKTISSNTLIYNYAHLFVKLNYTEKLSLSYFKFIKSIKKEKIKKNVKIVHKKYFNNKKLINVNKYTNFLLSKYRSICNKIFILYKKENPKFIRFILDNTKKIKNQREKKIIMDWHQECIAKYYIAQNLNKENTYVFFDEGLVQRSLFLFKVSSNYKKRMENYILLSELPNYLIFLDNKTSKLLQRSRKRENIKDSSFKYKDINQIRKYKKFFKDYLSFLKKKNKF